MLLLVKKKKTMYGHDVILERLKQQIKSAKLNRNVELVMKFKRLQREYKANKKANKSLFFESFWNFGSQSEQVVEKRKSEEFFPKRKHDGPAVAIHRIRQHQFSLIARKTSDYAGKLIAPCTCCSAPRACIFNSSIFYNDELKRWEAYCASCTAYVSVVDRTLLKATYDILRVGTWVAQFGVQANGECCACATQLDFWNFHRAHDIAWSLVPDGTIDSIRNSFISCQTCNLGTGIIPFSKVIVDTRAHLKLEPLRERSDSSMVLQGIAWMNDKNPVGMCPWNMGTMETLGTQPGAQ